MLQKAINNLKNQEGEGEGGFTLIELLVVILIIGILAAIALPTFLGQSDKAKDSSAKSNARNLVTQVESCYTTTGDYGACTVTNGTPSAAMDTGGISGSVSATANQGVGYTVIAVSDSKNTFTITKTASGSARTCSTTGGTDKGGCKVGSTPNQGTW